MTEAPITTTLKAAGGPTAPWLVIRSENTVQLKQQLAELQANGTFAELATANEAFSAHFTVGNVLGAKPINPPVDTGAFAQPAPEPAAPVVDAAAAALQQQIAALQAQQAAAAAPAAYAAPAAATPGAPIVAGMPAKLVSGTGAGGNAWQAWADPRPKAATDHMQKTDDVNHPGLNAGTHKLWKFIR